jgi:hypothetical protein
VPGGYFNAATGDYSFAAGSRAKANHRGSFVWADSLDADFASTANDQLSIRAAGGVRLNTDTSVFFGAQTRQMLNLWTNKYGIGVQPGTMYFRADNAAADNGFAWFRGGSHAEAFKDPGPGGQLLMGLDDRGLFVLRGDVNWSLGGQLADNQGGSLELGPKFDNTGKTPFIDFHFGSGSIEDFNVRLINDANNRLTLVGNLNVTGTITPPSDRNVKAGFEAVDPRVILGKVASLPITRWHYTNDVSTPHLGPIAQDFYAAFGVGSDDKHIATVDADGVALAAIQGLNEKVETRSRKSEDRIQKLEAENLELRRELEALNRAIGSLASSLNGGTR